MTLLVERVGQQLTPELRAQLQARCADDGVGVTLR